MKKQLILFLILLLVAIPAIYAEQPKSVVKEAAPELKVKEADFSYANYNDSVKFIKGVITEYENGKKYDPDLDLNYIGIPNNLLIVEGYGLFAQKEVIRLKLENAKLKGTDKESVKGLESQSKDAENQIKKFLSENTWVD